MVTVLPPVAAPFVTAAPYRVRADLNRLGQSPAHVHDPGPATLVRLDDDAPRALDHALRELREAPEAVRAWDRGVAPARLHAVAWALAAALAAEGDPRVRIEGDGLAFPWLGVRVDAAGGFAVGAPSADTPPALAARAADAAAWLVAQDPVPRPLDALELALQEDLVVLTRPAGDDPDRGRGAARAAVGDAGRDRGASGAAAGDPGRAVYLNVVAPSGWDPGSRAGASFADLHAPVPHRAPLDAAATALTEAICTRGPFVRTVWSLAPDAALGRHPRRVVAPAQPVAPRDLVYRVERQTTFPVPGADAGVFLIRVFTRPLAEVARDPDRRAVLAAAVASMDDALLAYKGLADGRDALLAWLGGG